MMKGNQVDISEFCEFAWYEWIMFNYSPISFPEVKLALSYWPGPAPNVGSGFTAKIMKAMVRSFATLPFML